MTTGILAGLWDLLPCTNTEKYICKHLAEGAVLTVPPPTQSPPKCAEGWTQVGTRHYCSKVQKLTRLNMSGKYCNNTLKSISNEAVEVSPLPRSPDTAVMWLSEIHIKQLRWWYIYIIFSFYVKQIKYIVKKTYDTIQKWKKLKCVKQKKFECFGNTALISSRLRPAESQFL